MLIIGIDPGASGAISVLAKDVNLLKVLLKVEDMPVTPKNTGKGNEVNAYLLTRILKNIIESYKNMGSVFVGIEGVSAMPGQGVTSMFSFGRSLGVIEGVCAGLELRVQFIRPAKWKKAYNLTGKEKDQSRTCVISMFPDKSELFKRKKDVGRADATLIADYLYEQLNNK